MDFGRVTLSIEIHIPQLDALGERLMEALDPINQSLDRMTVVLEQELTEIADELRRLQDANPTAEQVGAIVARVDTLADRVRNILPSPPAAPPV